MKISRKLAIQILKYCFLHKDFYFPFLVVCKEYSPEDNDFVEIEPSEWAIIDEDENYKTFELWENLQSLNKETLELMAKGFLEKITEKSLLREIEKLAKEYRSQWREELWKSEDIEEFGENEFLGGRADAAEDCLDIIRSYSQHYGK